MAQYVFSMNRVGKIVPPKRHILKDISLSFFPGAKIGVLGLNGSGKSTLLNCIAGLEQPDRGTLQLAAGMNLHVFTTGRGTPYGLAECPVIKVATRNDLARRWHDLMDMNAGRIADGEITIEEAGWELFRILLDVASGRKTWAEQWRLHNALVLFNPAPIT